MTTTYFLQEYRLPRDGSPLSRIRFGLVRLWWTALLTLAEGPSAIAFHCNEPRPGKETVTVSAEVRRLFPYARHALAQKWNDFKAPFDPALRADIAFAVGAMIVAVASVFGAAVEGVIAGGSIAVFLAMLFNG